MSPTQPGPVCDIALRRPVFAATPQHTPARRYDATLCPVRRALMRRREFITLLGGAAAGWPLADRAQRGGKLPTIGLLGGSSADTAPENRAAFVRRLQELGWIEGRTVAIEYRYAEGRPERFS